MALDRAPDSSLLISPRDMGVARGIGDLPPWLREAWKQLVVAEPQKFTTLEGACQIPSASGKQFTIDTGMNERIFKFNNTQLVVLGCLVTHHVGNQEMAEHLDTSFATARGAVNSLLARMRSLNLDVPLRGDLIVEAHESGLVGVESPVGGKPAKVDPDDPLGAKAEYIEIWPPANFFSRDKRGLDRRYALDKNLAERAEFTGRMLDTIGCLAAKRSKREDIGICLGVSEDAARDRVTETIRRLKKIEEYKDVDNKTGIVAELLANNALVRVFGEAVRSSAAA